MSNVCMRCAKGSSAQRTKRKLLRGHYNPTARRIKRPNLQRVRLAAPIAAKWKLPASHRLWLCVKCIRSISKTIDVKEKSELLISPEIAELSK